MDKIMGFLPFMLECTVVTVEIFVLTLVISLPLGLPVALGSNSRIKPLSILCKTYVWIFRGTPLLLQLFFFYYFFPLVLDIKGMNVFVTVLLTFVLNLFMFDGTVLWHWKFLTITYEGLYRSCFMALRLILLIIGTSMLTLTTKPMELTDGLEKLLKPFNRFGLPSHEIALMMSIALRFIPTLLEETDKIMKAQQARGADFESGNLIQRVKNMIPILIPLFVGSFRIAQDLALAMEARCYHGGVGRTRMKEIVFSRRDVVTGVLLAVFLGIVIASRWMPLP